MGVKVSASGGGEDFERPQPGAYVARCWRVVDMGTQRSNWQGKESLKRKVLISWELLSGEKMKDGRPFTVSQRFTASLGEKATLRKTLEGWRGRKFTPEELESFDLSVVLGRPCMVTIVEDDRGGKTYTNVQSVSPLMAGMSAPAMTNKQYDLSLDEDFDEQVFEQLSDGLKEQIKKSPEYAAITGQPAAEVAATADDDIDF